MASLKLHFVAKNRAKLHSIRDLLSSPLILAAQINVKTLIKQQNQQVVTLKGLSVLLFNVSGKRELDTLSLDTIVV